MTADEFEMQPGDSMSSIDDAAAGRAAAELLYRIGPDHPIDERFTIMFAKSALNELSRLMTEDMPGLLKAMLDGATASAEQLNVEGLAGLIEILQNADDERASEVRLAVRDRDSALELLIAHDGDRVGLVDTAAMALAYVSTKRQDAKSKGRFGIGLKTLGRISSGMAVHCHPYHFEIAEQGPRLVPAEPAITGFYHPESFETLLVLRLREGVTEEGLAAWFEDFDAGALLFLDTVRAVRFHHLPSAEVLERRLDRTAVGEDGPVGWLIRVDRLEDAAGHQSWLRYSTEVRKPPNLHRAGKQTADEVPIAIAVPSTPEPGRVHAGLPVTVRTALPYSLNAQFDPDTSRSRVQHERWNVWLVRELARLAARVAVARAAVAPTSAWAVVPLDAEATLSDDTWLQEQLHEHVTAVQKLIGDEIRVPINQTDVQLDEVAYEDELLDGLLSEDDMAELVDAQPFPHGARDGEGRWRVVLDELELSTRIEVEDALVLLDDEHNNRPAVWYAELLAVALEAGLAESVVELPCVVLEDASRIAPPQHLREGVVLSDEGNDDGRDDAARLLIELGLAKRLHPTYLTGDRAKRVSDWLKQLGTLQADISPDTALRVLGEYQGSVEPADEQVRTIRDLLMSVDDSRQERIAASLGGNVALAGYSFVGGAKTERRVKPAAAYLPSRIEGGSGGWAPTAGTAGGLMWLHGRYSTVLRPTKSGRLGARAFLTLLRAAVAPRLAVPRQAEHRYNDPASPIAPQLNGALQARAVRELAARHPRGRRATHLQHDRIAPDLEAVVAEIVALPVRDRGERARGLLATITRGWRRHYADFEIATAVYSDYRRTRLGPVPATWLSRLASARWMSDQQGTARAPIDLAVRTPEMLNVFGEQPEWYAAEVDIDRDLTVLEALGMKTQPTTEDILTELTLLRDGYQAGEEVNPADTARLYLALAQRCPPVGKGSPASPVGELTVAQLRGRFGIGRQQSGLLYWHGHWWPPSAVYRGEPIFGDRRPFVPEQAQLEPLWEVLSLRRPKAEVCLVVLREIGAEPLVPQERGVLLQTYRYLSRYSDGSPKWRASLQTLPLWTAQGWVTTRPIYAVEDRALRDALVKHLPIWLAPGALDTFGELPSWAGVVLLDRSDFSLHGMTPEARQAGAGVAEIYRTAVRHLHDMLLAEDPSLYNAISIAWPQLTVAPVALTGDLSVEVTVPDTGTFAVPIGAHVSRDPIIVSARDADALRESELGGAAIASLFGRAGEEGVDRTKLALLWEKAWRRAERGELPENLEVATIDQADDFLDDLEAELKLPRKAKRKVSKPPTPEPKEGGARPLATRQLKTAVELDLEGVGIREGSPPPKKGSHKRPLKRDLPPERNQQAPRTAPAAFTQNDVETFGWELLRETLRTREISELTDFRNQHGIGADAVDELLRFFEIKAYARDMPDEVSLTAAEAERAAEKGGAYFLAVIAGLEQGCPTKMRIFPNPLGALEWRPSTSIHLGGVKTQRGIDVPFKDVEGDDDTETP